jgi:hypothetical protein
MLLIAACHAYKAYVVLEPIGRQQTPGGRLVELNGFSLKAPPGKAWGIDIDEERKMVTFARVKRHSRAGQVLGLTMIQVYRNKVVDPKMENMDEGRVADLFMAQEAKILEEAGIAVTDAKRDVTVIGGKKLYTLTYKTTKLRYPNSALNGVPIVSGNALFLYFPPDFAKTRDIFVFLINDACRPDSLAASADVGQIYPVIDSLKITPR